MSSAYYFFLSWGLIFLIMVGLSKFEGGRTILYYIFVMAILLDIVTHSQELVDIFSQGGFPTDVSDTAQGT